ncbi:MAG TPA: hypothetical protein DHN33_09060 [Eubacteriaceae bacterium]|nr:hypothetical protein [Eubacteriaceae bacterium]
MPVYHVVLVKPTFSISTAWAYGQFKGKKLAKRPDNRKMIEAIERGDRQAIETELVNVFEETIFTYYPQIQEIKEQLKTSGAQAALMSGSGPSVYGLFREQEAAKKAYDYFRGSYKEVFVVKTCKEVKE